MVTTITKRVGNAAGVLVQPAGDTGDTPFTDNAIARFSGNAGALQNSGITIDDSNVMAGAYVLATGSNIARTLEARFTDVVSVLDFIPLALHAAIKAYTSTTDVSSYIQAAHDAQNSSGACLFFPPGKYRVSGNTTLSKAGLYFGCGDATVIETSSATATIFTYAGNGLMVVRGMRFTTSVTRTGGQFIDITGNKTFTEHFSMEGAWNGFRVTGTANNHTIQHGSMREFVASSGSLLVISMNAGSDGVVTFRDIVADHSANIFAGVQVTCSGEVTIEDCDLIHCGNVVYLNPGSGQTIAAFWANNCFFDTSSKGLYAKAEGGNIVRANFDQCWFSSHSGEGIRIEISSGTIDGIDFINCFAHLNGGHGLAVVSAGVKNVRWLGGAMAQNIGDGVNIAANTNEFSILGARIGAAEGLTANANGIIIGAGTSNNYVIAYNDLRGNTSAALTDGGSGTSKYIYGNLGSTANAIVVSDANFSLQDDGDGTKQVKFQLSGITTATIRTKTFQDVSGTIYESGGTDVPVADGGTGASSLTSNAVLKGAGTSAIVASGVSIDGSNNVTGVNDLTTSGNVKVGGDLLKTVDNSQMAFYGGSTFDGGAGIILYGESHASLADVIQFANANFTERARITAVGNLKIGGTAVRGTTEGTRHIDIFDGTAPSGTLSNGVSLYSASGELRSLDAAGNSTLLSPHDKVTNEWVYDSVDTRTGKHLRIDMERMLKAINERFGWDFVHEFVERP